MLNKLNVNATTFPTISPEQKAQMPVVDESKILGGLQKTYISSNGAMYIDGEYPLSFGAVVSSEYGYAGQLDEVSREYMLARKTDNYSGEEAKSRLKVLDNIFRAKLGPSIDTSSVSRWNNTLAAIDEQTNMLK